MKKRTSIKINDCIISVSKVANDYLVLSITGRENGFKTGVKLTAQQTKQLYEVIRDCECVGIRLLECNIKDVHAKHVEYTKTNDEDNFTHKFFEDKNCTIKIVSIGGHCIISLSANMNYRTISFEVGKYMDLIREFKETINSIHMELNMKEW